VECLNFESFFKPHIWIQGQEKRLAYDLQIQVRSESRANQGIELFLNDKASMGMLSATFRRWVDLCPPIPPLGKSNGRSNDGYASQQLALATNHAFSQEPVIFEVFHNNFVFDKELCYPSGHP
jgi:hypothetical protein